MSKCAHELCKYWNKERKSCFFFIEGSGEIEDMPCKECWHKSGLDVVKKLRDEAVEEAMKQEE